MTETPLDSMCLETENITVYRVRGDRWKEAPGAWREGAQHGRKDLLFSPRIFSVSVEISTAEVLSVLLFFP